MIAALAAAATGCGKDGARKSVGTDPTAGSGKVDSTTGSGAGSAG